MKILTALQDGQILSPLYKDEEGVSDVRITDFRRGIR